jgi:Zn finger protein HypA/HybF involved in hydrogenase expression
MHKLSLIADLIRKLDSIAHEQHPAKIIDVTIKLGAHTHVSVPHLREHFVQACRGTSLESTRLVIEIGTDPSDLHAQDILLDRVQVEG